MSEMRKMTLEGFAGELASNSPAPGGGSVAALCGSLAAALTSMVHNLTIGKKFYNEYDETLQNKIKDFQKICDDKKGEFLHLMDVDTDAFNQVMDAFKLPKETDEEKAFRSKKIQEGYTAAMEVPLNVARKIMGLFEYLELAVNSGNPNAVSDAGVGTLIALTGLEGAILNVKINLGSIKDKNLVDSVTAECDNLMKLGNEKKNTIMEIVYSKIS